MNKQEAIKLIEKLEEHYGISEGVYLEKRDVINIISQIDEPQKPVVPKFVADYIEFNKGWSEEYIEDDSSGLWFALDGSIYGMPNSVSDWLFNEEKVETFARAWLDGYEIEKEKLYTVEIPNPNGVVVCLERLDGGKIALSTLGESRLTESEIKKTLFTSM